MSGSSRYNRMAGIVAFVIDGAVWNVADACEYKPSQVTREGVKGQSAPVGFSEMPDFGMISATLYDRGDATVYSLNQKTASTIDVLAANGKSISGSSMFQTGEIKVGTKEGTFAVTFEGDVAESLARTGGP